MPPFQSDASAGRGYDPTQVPAYGLAGDRTGPSPGTLGGLLVRLDALSKISVGVAEHVVEVRERLCGSAPPEANNKIAPPKGVPRGAIEEMNDIVDGAERAVRAAIDHLEFIWSKIG